MKGQQVLTESRNSLSLTERKFHNHVHRKPTIEPCPDPDKANLQCPNPFLYSPFYFHHLTMPRYYIWPLPSKFSKTTFVRISHHSNACYMPNSPHPPSLHNSSILYEHNSKQFFVHGVWFPYYYSLVYIWRVGINTLNEKSWASSKV